LQAIGIGFLELREPGPDGTFGRTDVPKQSPAIRRVFTNPLVLNSDLTAQSGADLVASGQADAVSYGRPFISNPDLVARIRDGKAWTENDMRTWYSAGPEGYTDYPSAA
ncbi:MAG: NADH:flavin oxidoreductase, partial [Pseudomonadota bacterium]